MFSIQDQHIEKALFDAMSDVAQFYAWLETFDSTQVSILHWWDQQSPRLIVPPSVCGVAQNQILNPISVFLHDHIGSLLFEKIVVSQREHHVVAYMASSNIHARVITRDRHQIVVASGAIQVPQWAQKVHTFVTNVRRTLVVDHQQRLRHWVSVNDAQSACRSL